MAQLLEKREIFISFTFSLFEPESKIKSECIIRMFSSGKKVAKYRLIFLHFVTVAILLVNGDDSNVE